MKFPKIAVITSILLFTLFFLSLTSYAVSNNSAAADSQAWVKLKSDPFYMDGKLLIKLSNDETQIPSQNVYIVECVDSLDDRVCSTGTEEGDSIIYQSDSNLQKMKQLYNYTFNNIFLDDRKTVQKNPVPTNQKGEIPILWVDSQFSSDVIRVFYGVNIKNKDNGAVSVTTNTVKDYEDVSGGGLGGQQQALIRFPTLTPTPTPTPTPQPTPCCIPIAWNEPQPTASDEELHRSEGGCEILKGTWKQDDNGRWGCDDPYGRVFDAVSLEPLANAKVTLLNKKKDGTFGFMSPKETTNAIINPWTTKEDGKYVYLVPPGTYQVNIDLPNYTFPFTPTQLNQNYEKAYYELYYAPGFTDKNIVEVKTEHRDIPVMPKGEPYHADIKLLGYVAELNKEKLIYEVTGRASHPLTIVDIIGQQIDNPSKTRVLTRITADKWGFFNVQIPTSKLNTNEIVGWARLIKVDLTEKNSHQSKNTFFNLLFSWITDSYAQTSDKSKTTAIYSINPILNYLEGYAYDEFHKPIPNARIGIYLSGSKKVYYIGKANAKGYYSIDSQFLPPINYVISYQQASGKSNTVTQTQFLAENANNLVSDKISVNKYVGDVPVSKMTIQERQFAAASNNKKIKNPVNENTTIGNNKIIYLLIIILFLVIGTVGILLYIKKRKTGFKDSI